MNASLALGEMIGCQIYSSCAVRVSSVHPSAYLWPGRGAPAFADLEHGVGDAEDSQCGTLAAIELSHLGFELDVSFTHLRTGDSYGPRVSSRRPVPRSGIWQHPAPGDGLGRPRRDCVILLVRHADAQPWTADPARPLSSRGEKDAVLVGDLLAELWRRTGSHAERPGIHRRLRFAARRAGGRSLTNSDLPGHEYQRGCALCTRPFNSLQITVALAMAPARAVTSLQHEKPPRSPLGRSAVRRCSRTRGFANRDWGLPRSSSPGSTVEVTVAVIFV